MRSALFLFLMSACTSLLLALSDLPALGQRTAPSNTPLALVGATIYTSPTDDRIHDGVVLIEGTTISAVGPKSQVRIPLDAQVLDCSGLAITAGFWNSHVHFFERKWSNAAAIPASELALQLEAMLTRYGFTSVFDLGSMWENTRAIRYRIESGEVPGPKIRSTGEALVPPGALPSDTVLSMMGTMKFPAPEIAYAAQASAAAQRLLDDGVDGIKLFASSPRSKPLTVETLQAAVDEAHKAGKLAFVHPNSGADILTAVRAGVDIIGHTTPQSGPWDHELLAAMKRRGVALTPTLTIWKYYARHDRISAQEQIVNTELGQLRTWLASSGVVLFGSDLGAIDYDPIEEYSLMSGAGMDFRQILAALTTAPAGRFGDASHLGRITPGYQADLVVLAGDPAKNLHALTAVQYTLRAGKIIYRAPADPASASKSTN
ncbi:MAG TPA: amidohydrolase family protein [Candidatus Methylomirabilis sp.]|nr:amidohydrolase family protein [Candidatus Methylomirabilis sp.]